MPEILQLCFVWLALAVAADVCSPAADTSAWAFSAPKAQASYSCVSAAGGTNDMGNAPTMCSNDPASVRIELMEGKAECLRATAGQCKIPMHDFVSMDYEFTFDSCNGLWAAPLWMTPDKWQWGPGSGEIDSLEFCPRSGAYMNFAGGGHQLQAPGVSIDASSGHVTVRKDEQGIVTIATCSSSAAQANNQSFPQCHKPVYRDCNDCQWGKNHTFACWCNPGKAGNPNPNIYGSGGCQNGGDCSWTLVSDLWNGVSGDAGYAGCMTAVESIGLEKGKPNLKSGCKLSVEKIVLKGHGPNGSLQWAKGSPASCAALTTASP